jgi:hypothetical protein
MPQFEPGVVKQARAPITVAPAGLQCTAELYLGPGENVKSASSGLVDFVSTGAQKTVLLPITMPGTGGVYHVFIDVRAGGALIGRYQALEDVVIKKEAVPGVTFSVKIGDIPDYAAAAYQWFVDYGGENWGMIDPQNAIWTPINEPITVTGPETGNIRVFLYAGPGPSQLWEFSAGRKFIPGKEYTFQLEAGILASGVALTDLVVTPEWMYQGETASISVTAVNSEDEEQVYEIVFLMDDAEVNRQSVLLEPRESRVVGIELSPAEVGKHRIQVEALGGWLEVKEYYPPIEEPIIESLNWKPPSQWPSEGALLEGVLMLPRPGNKLQQVAIELWLTGYIQPVTIFPWIEEGNEGITYLGDGRWRIDIGLGYPFYNAGDHWCTVYDPRWVAYCPCSHGAGQWRFSSPVSAQHALDRLRAHMAEMCGGVSPYAEEHCTTPVSLANVQQEYKETTSWSNHPCPGEILSLTLKVILYQVYEGGGGADILRNWEYENILSFTV